MKKVVILCGDSPADKRGLQAVSLMHAKALQKRGCNVSLFARGPEDDSFFVDGIPVNTYKYSSSSNPFLNFYQMRQSCQQAWKNFYTNGEPDILHGHCYLTYFFLEPLLSKRIRNIFTVHDPLVYHQRMLGNIKPGSFKEHIFRYIEKKVHKNCDALHVISQYTANRLISRKKDGNEKIVYNWVDTEKFVLPKDRGQVRAQLGIGEKDFIVFTLRVLEPRMGIDNLIKGFGKICSNIPDSKLVIGGKGPQMSQLTSLAQELSLTNVTFLGYVPDDNLIKWYQAADLFILPSLDGEGFGLPILEAMACGTPVLGTPVCAIPEVLSGKQDRLLKGTSAENISQGLMKFYKQWKEEGVSPENEREYVLERFTEEKIFPLILEDYIKLESRLAF